MLCRKLLTSQHAAKPNNIKKLFTHVGQMYQIDHDLDQIDHDLDKIDHDLDQIDHDQDPLDTSLPI